MRATLTHWTTIVPALGVLALLATWERPVSPVVAGVLAILLGATVMAAVHHAEVVAHKVGEPFGSIVLAVAVTIIEVGLIVTLMFSGKPGAETLARDTVFAALMITVNGIVGLALLVGAHKFGFNHFHPEGSGAALATVLTLATMCLVVPTFTLGAAGPLFTGPQLIFAGTAALALYILFITTQTVRHRDFFLPVDDKGAFLADDVHAAPPTAAEAARSLGLLLASLVAVVGLAKVESPFIEWAVKSAGLPTSFVGIIIALLVLAPETLAAVNNARRRRTQTSLNLAYGSAAASIGLTVPTLAALSGFLPVPLHLGLDPVHIVLLTVTAVVSVLTVVPGRATRLQGGVHLILLVAYVFLAANP